MKVVGVLVAAAGLAAPVFAQDSVSNAPLSGAGDALDPYAGGQQRASYVVDMDELTTSWGTRLGVAPIVKLSRANPAFYTSLSSASGISATLLDGQSFNPASYGFWTAAGRGVHPTNNNAPGALPGGAVDGLQFAVMVNEFETGPNGATTPYYAGIAGAIVNYEASDPSRLYVRRVQAAVNGPNATEERASFGGGSVDSHGNVYFRADDFQLNGSNLLVDDNWFHVRLAARGGVVNVIDSNGGIDATTPIDLSPAGVCPVAPGAPFSSSPVMLTPSVLSEQLAGRSVAVGANFNNEYVFENCPGVAQATSGHRSPLVANQRGSVHVSKTVVFPGTVATAAMVGNSNGAIDLGDRIFLWGLNADGSPSGQMTLEVPILTGATDNDDGFSSGFLEHLTNYRSQVAFRGGNSQIGLGRDQNGNLIVAATANILGPWNGAIARNPLNCVLVAKVDAQQRVAWTLAGHTGDPAGTTYPGKQIRDGRNGAAIGRQVEMYLVTGAIPPNPPMAPYPANFGPSISCPMVDSVGNVYFLSAVELNRPQGVDFDVALIRAVYDPATFSYQLEKVLETGDTFDGLNSATPYQISFLELVDSDSISSAAPFSHNIVQDAAHGQNPAGLDTADPATLGGMVISARIVYDTDGVPGFTPATDENYRVLLYLGDLGGGCPCACEFDVSTGPGVCDIFDFLAFQNGYSVNDPCACNKDVSTGPDLCDIFDFLEFQNEYAGGCP